MDNILHGWKGENLSGRQFYVSKYKKCDYLLSNPISRNLPYESNHLSVKR